MWRITAAVVGVLALASCASAGANHDAPSPSPAPSNPPVAAQAVAAALAFASHSDPEVGVVDGYASVPPAVQRGQQPIALGGGQANPCAQRPAQRFTASEQAAIRDAFHGRTVRFVQDPAGWLGQWAPGRCCWWPRHRCWASSAERSWCSAACPIHSRCSSRCSGMDRLGRPRQLGPGSADPGGPPVASGG
jgi:hypothetical protein